MTGCGQAASSVIVDFESAQGGIAEVKFSPVGRLAFLESGANPFRRSDKLPSGAPDLDFVARLTLLEGLQKNPKVTTTPHCLKQSNSHHGLHFKRVHSIRASS